MATTFAALTTKIRFHLIEASAVYWTDAEIAGWLSDGCQDLWRAINDLHQEHFCTIDITNVTYEIGATSLAGVPADVYRVHLIEPRDTTINAATRNILFQPRDYNDANFIYARSLDNQDPTQAQIFYYSIINAGPPVGTPTVVVAPKSTAQILLRVMYVPVLAALDSSSTNPIPGQSDNALVAWGVAYARAKEREDRSPDPNWLAVYATEKQNILTSLTPRQDQEPDIVPGVFEPYQLF